MKLSKVFLVAISALVLFGCGTSPKQAQPKTALGGAVPTNPLTYFRSGVPSCFVYATTPVKSYECSLTSEQMVGWTYDMAEAFRMEQLVAVEGGGTVFPQNNLWRVYKAPTLSGVGITKLRCDTVGGGWTFLNVCQVTSVSSNTLSSQAAPYPAPQYVVIATL